MAGAPALTFIGNLTADPELRFTPSGAAVANFTVACTERLFDKQAQEWKEGDTAFIRCTVWRQYAENVAESLLKGQRVIVVGTLRIRQFDTKEGGKGTSVECQVDEVGPALTFGTTRFTRTAQGGGGRQQQKPAADPWASGGASGFPDEPPF